MKKESWSIIGGILAAIGASLCCAGPLVLLSIGVSGAWIANLTELDPYRPYFIGLVILLFAWAGWQLFKAPLTGTAPCSPEDICANPTVLRNRRVLFVIAAVIAVALVLSPYWIIFFA